MRNFVIALLLFGCSPIASEGTDAGPDPSCDTIDRECPAVIPYGGNACEGALSCPYEDLYLATCNEGVWSVEATCVGCVPPLVEGCAEPFSGSLTGASVVLGPPGTTRAFENEETIEVIWGAQGSPMVAAELRVSGANAPPCVSYASSITVEGGGDVDIPAAPVRLHCGTSRTVLTIVPDGLCDSRDYFIDITAQIAGVGETSARVRVRGGKCTG
jgi:hypothetical protein